MRRILVKLALISAIGLLLLPAIVPVRAAVPTYGEEIITTPQGFIDLIKGITKWIFSIVMAIAILFIILAAWYFLTAAGNPEAIAKARQMLIYAIVGIAVALLAAGLPALINAFLGATGTTPTPTPTPTTPPTPTPTPPPLPLIH